MMIIFLQVSTRNLLRAVVLRTAGRRGKKVRRRMKHEQVHR